MPDFSIAQLKTAIAEQQFPTVTLWNRLESRPRAREFGRALRAEVRDALWMLTRQWQMGELEGDDAGSPAAAILRAGTNPVTTFRGLRGPERAIAHGAPLEVDIERRRPRLVLHDHPIALDLRLAMGRRWLRMIAPIDDYADLYRDAYAFAPLNPNDEANVLQAAHPEVAAMLMAISGRAMDGGGLYLHLVGTPPGKASDGVAIAAGDVEAIDKAGEAFVAWFKRLITQDDKDADAWSPPNLEHRFDLGAGSAEVPTTLHADQYGGGRLDWYEFDVDPRAAPITAEPGADAPKAKLIETTTIPAQVSYEGMPSARWWAFEDAKVNLADVRPEPTNVGALLLLEFLLVYSNDWRLSPLTVPVNSLVQVEGLLVENVFGERTWIEPAGKGDDDDRQRWSMFGLSSRGDVREPADQRLLVIDAAGAPLRSEPIEQVALLRDEIANMVWGVERIIQSPTGGSKQGAEAGEEVRAALAALAAAPPAPERLAPARYRLETTTPENWIPFVPVRLEGESRAIQLQRAVTRRIIEDIERGLVRPRTSLLRDGLDSEPQAPYYLYEEEVPRSGALVTLRYERARGTDGRAHVWLAAVKGTGRGDGSSGLAFDLLDEARPNG